MSLVPPPRTGADSPMSAAARRESAQQQRIQAHRAARAVAGRSRDAQECAELLAMLGLTAGDDDPVY